MHPQSTFHQTWQSHPSCEFWGFSVPENAKGLGTKRGQQCDKYRLALWPVDHFHVWLVGEAKRTKTWGFAHWMISMIDVTFSLKTNHVQICTFTMKQTRHSVQTSLTLTGSEPRFQNQAGSVHRHKHHPSCRFCWSPLWDEFNHHPNFLENETF